MHENFSWRRVLQELAAVHHGDAVAKADRLFHVVSDEENRRRKLALERLEVVLGLGANQRVEGAERLVHQQQFRLGGERARDAHPLLLAAGQLIRAAMGESRRIELKQSQELLDPSGDAATVPPSNVGTVAMFSATLR